MSAGRVEQIRQRLQAALAAPTVEVRDDSAQHAGHPGAAGGAGHFSVRIVSPEFEGRSRLHRHRLVYQALADMMPTEIHALSIDAISPNEGPKRKP